MKIKEKLFTISVLTAACCISVLFLLIALIAGIDYPWSLFLLIPSALLSAYERFTEAFFSAGKLEFDENILISLSLLFLFISGHAAAAALSAILLRASFIAVKAILLKLKKQRNQELPAVSGTAWISLDDGTYKEIPSSELTVGKVILARPYEDEFIPADGVVVQGEGLISSAALNGNTELFRASPGSVLYSGMQSVENPIHIKITALPQASAAAKIQSAMSPSEQDASFLNPLRLFCKFAAPAALIIILIFILISVLAFDFGISSSLYVSGAALLCLSPALLIKSVISALYLAQSGGIKKGMIFTSLCHMERLSSADAVVFDGAENLFASDPVIEDIIDINGAGKENIMLLFGALLQNSTLPEAKAVRAGVDGISLPRLDREVEKKGLGVAAELNGKRFLCGKKELFSYVGIPTGELDAELYLSIGKRLCGALKIKADPIDLTHTSVDKINSDFTQDIFVIAKDDGEIQEYRLDELTGCSLKLIPSDSEKEELLNRLCQNHKNTVIISRDCSFPFGDLPVTQVITDFNEGIAAETPGVITSARDSDDILNLLSYARKNFSFLRFFTWLSADAALLLFGFAIFGYLPAALCAAAGALPPVILLGITAGKNKLSE